MDQFVPAPATRPVAHVGSELAKVTLKSNGDEALSDEFLLKSNDNEALNDVFP
jgi:hypothetical protein